MARGTGQRCWGFRSDDGVSVICTQVESDRLAESASGYLHSKEEGDSAVPPDNVSVPPATGRPEAVYRYEDEKGAPLFEVLRYTGKRFVQRKPNGEFGIQGIRRVIYHLPQVIDAVSSGQTVYIVEGEKDVHAMETAGYVATCNPGGAGKWSDDFSRYLQGADVIIVADRDDGPGINHARQVRTSLLPVAGRVSICQAAEGKDAFDHLQAGLDVSDLVPVPPRFKVVDLSEHEPEPALWLVEPVLLRGTYHLIPAKAGEGKTMFALCVALEAIRQGGTVVYLDEENGSDVLKERAMAIGYSPDELRARFLYVPYPNASLEESSDLVAEVAALKPDLVVFDAKANFLSAADLAEDSAMDNTRWHREIIQPLQRHDAAVVDLDHTGHHTGSRSRGSASKAAVAEAEWRLSTSREFSPDRTAILTLTRGQKNRRGQLPQKLKYEFGGDGNGGFIFRPLSTSNKEKAAMRRETQIRKEIQRAVDNHFAKTGEGLSMSALNEMIKGQRSTIVEVARKLAEGPDAEHTIVPGPRKAEILTPLEGRQP